MSQAIVSFGGPFPYDKSFRGQLFVMGDLIREATSRKMYSRVISKYHENKNAVLAAMEAPQRKIAKVSFLSDLEFRYKCEFNEARKRHNSTKSVLEWASFYGLDKLQTENFEKVFYFMHYYNARFQDARVFSELLPKMNLGNRIKPYYFIHVTPDQLIESGIKEEWRNKEKSGTTVDNLVASMRNNCFKAFIAVSNATRDMWLELIKDFGYSSEDMAIAEKSIRAVPNGIDSDLYKSRLPSSTIEQTKQELGFSNNVEKIVLIMTRPSVSKGIHRIKDVLNMIDGMTHPEVEKLGILVAMPETEGTEEFVAYIKTLKRLIETNRIKVTIDISKILRSKTELMEEFDKILKASPISYSNEPFFVKHIGYPLPYVSDVLLHLPYAEAFGLILGEAILSKCAIVTTDAGGIPKVVKNTENKLVLDHKSPSKAKIIDGLIALGRSEHLDNIFENQFSLKKQFDKIIGDNDG